MISWADICADKSLQDLPYKIETNRFDKIIMSPATFWHGGFQVEIASQLKLLLSNGRVTTECAIQTADGVKVPDVVWISDERVKPHMRAVVLPLSPEICVEVLSPGNSREEMLGKMQLYFELGAQEVWLCNEQGVMEYFLCDSSQPVPVSRMCPGFPKRIQWD